jgi:hypothetical protein
MCQHVNEHGLGRVHWVKIKGREFSSPVGKVFEKAGNPMIIRSDYHLLRQKDS